MRKVLIVNDHKDLNNAIETLLELKGFISKSTFSDENVHLVINSFKPEVIILNLNHKYTLSICSELSNKEDFNEVRIILFGNILNNTKRYKHIKVHGYLQSPFDVSSLLKLIEFKN